MRFSRPVALIGVFAIEVVLIYQYRAEVLTFARQLGDLELFKGLGTLLFPAPVAFLLWYWKDADKQHELRNDAQRLRNENEKLVLEKKILEGEATVARERVDKVKLEADLARLTAQLDKERMTRTETTGRATEMRDALEALEIQSMLAYLKDWCADGQVVAHQVAKLPKSQQSLPASLRTFLLTEYGKRMLKDYLDSDPFEWSEVNRVLPEADLPEPAPFSLASR